MFFPVRPQYANDRSMIDPDRSLQNNKQLWRNARPAFAEEQVVSVLNPYPGRATNHIQGIEQFLNVQKFTVPGIRLSGKGRLERLCGTLMSSAGVMKNDGQFAHGTSPANIF